MKHMRLVAVALFIMYVCMTVVAQEGIRATYQPLKDNRIKIVWSVNFPAESSSVQLRTQKTGIPAPIGIDQPAEQIKVDYDKQPTPTQATFTTYLEYGADKPLGDNTVSADLTVTAFLGSKDKPSKSASTTISLNPEAMRDYYGKIKELNDLIGNTVPKPDPAEITQWQVLKISDRSVTLRLTSSQNIRVNVPAYETNDPAKATGPTIFDATKGVLLLENLPTDVKVPELRDGKTYVLVVEEMPNPKNPAGRQLLRKVIDRDNGKPIKTLDRVRDPSVKVNGRPQPKKNEAVYVEVNATDATDVFAYVEGSYDNGNFVKVSDEVRLPQKVGPAPADPTLFAGQIPAALIPGRKYRVQVRAATNKSDDVKPATYESVEFDGPPSKLFDVVTFDIGPETLKFTPTGVTEAVKTSMVIKVNDRLLLSPCAEGGPLQPSCEVGMAQIFTALADRSKNPGAAPAAPQKSTVSFEVTVKAADQSDRIQTTTFAMAVTPPNLGTSAARNNWQNVLNFAKDVITGSGNTKLEPNKVKSSGIAGILGAMLRGFVVL